MRIYRASTDARCFKTSNAALNKALRIVIKISDLDKRAGAIAEILDTCPTVWPQLLKHVQELVISLEKNELPDHASRHSGKKQKSCAASCTG